MSIFKWFKKRQRDHDIEELYLEIVELRMTVNKALVAINKNLRERGRAMQIIRDEEPEKKKGSGLIKPYKKGRNYQ